MKPNTQKHFFFCSIIFLLFFATSNNAQISPSKQLYIDFDKTIGKENLPINNGLLHTNFYRIADNKHRYYPEDTFVLGSAVFENQDYFDIPLKYDLFLDHLIYRPQNAESVGIELSKENVTAFIINQKKFKLLSPLAYNSIIKKGYYEENFSGELFTFYIKHSRSKRDIFKNQIVMQAFEDDYKYYLYKDNRYYKIETKKDIINIFPDYKNKITDFYVMNRELERNNKSVFLEKFFPYLHTILIKKNPAK